MKITTFFLLITVMTVSASSFAQKITLNEKKASLEQVLAKIRQQSGFDILYSNDDLAKAVPVTVSLKDADLEVALRASLAEQALTFEIEDGTVLIKKIEKGFLEKVKEAWAAIDVSGTVYDENGQPLPGVTVRVKGGAAATTTDARGRFLLKKVDENATIVLSSIGYVTKELKAEVELGIIKLEIATTAMDEVKVIAYGQTTQRLSTGNVSTIKAVDIEKQPVRNPLLAMQGLVPGIQIIQNSGVPGSGVSVLIQGQNSAQNGSNPFYVVDGVPYDAQMLPGYGNTILGTSGTNGTPPNLGPAPTAGSPLNYINPNDIESISVLKDADATAIYGSRAANGAVIITTKKGKAGEVKVSISAFHGLGTATNTMKLLNTEDYLAMRREAFKNSNRIIQPTDYDLSGLWDQSRYTDWQKELFGGTAHYSTINASLSGGSDNVQYLFSGTWHRENTIYTDKSADVNGAFHFNLSTQSSNRKFTTQLFVNYMRDHNNLPSFLDMNATISLAPNAPAIYNSDGSLNWALTPDGSSSWENPRSSFFKRFNSSVDNIVANWQLGYELLPGLNFRSSLGFSRMTVKEILIDPLSAVAPDARPFAIPTTNFTNNEVGKWIVEPQLNYQKNWGSHQINLLVGATVQKSENMATMLNTSGYNSEQEMENPAAAASIQYQNADQASYRYAAVRARASYNYAGKYLLNLSANRDGTSRFGTNNNLHDFWSIGAGYVFSEEKLIKENLSFLSTGKLRVSYGLTGNDQIGDYSYLDLYKIALPGRLQYQDMAPYSVQNLSNPNLKWEETRKRNLGLDLGFFNDKITLTVDAFLNRSSNQLMTISTPSQSGVYSYLMNLPATVENKGFEFSIRANVLSKNNFNWSTSFNISHYKNTLLSFGTENALLKGQLFEGQDLNSRQLYHYLGQVDPGTGDYLFQGADGKATATPNFATDRTVTKSFSPKYIGGWQNTLSYKSVSLSFSFYFMDRIATTNFYGTSTPGYSRTNQPVTVLDHWQKPGDIKPIGKYYASGENFGNADALIISDGFLVNGRYVRLRNADLSWRMPEGFCKTLNLKKVILSLSGQNLLTFTKYKGLDPETFSALPPLRIVTAGIKADF